jgi:hypothetical protein
VSTPAVVVVAVCTSNALWLALSRRYGTPTDVGGGMLAAAVSSGPALLLLGVLGATGRPMTPACFPPPKRPDPGC